MFCCLPHLRQWLWRSVVSITVFAVLFANASSVLAAPAAQQGATWLVMLYQDADDAILEQDIVVDLNEVERIGSTDQVTIVSQLDRFAGAYDGDGDWTTTKRYYVTYDEDLEVIASDEIEDIGEASMSDGDTLVDFVTWAAGSYPADKYVLILSDHGAGWPGGWSDPDPEGYGKDDIALAENGDQLFLMELDQALARAREATGIDQFELIGFDACLMSHLEVFTAVAPYARYAVASQETEPSLGWAYTSFLRQLAENPEMDGAQLASAIVDTYIVEDSRIVDPRARAQMLMDNLTNAGELAPEQIDTFRTELDSMTPEEIEAQIPPSDEYVADMSKEITLTAVDLSEIPNVLYALGELSFALTMGVDQSLVAEARTYAQSFTSIFGDDVPPSYIDLGSFAMLLQETVADDNVTAAADGLLQAMSTAIIAEKHGVDRPGATGISIYFPNSALFGMPVSGYQSYATVANRFAAATFWDDFLLYHYTGAEIQVDMSAIPGDEAIPAEGTLAEETLPEVGEITAPGAGNIYIEPLQLSAEEVSLDEPLTLSTNITGDHIGYIYLFVGYYDEESNSMLVADMDFVDNEDNKEIGGVIYPAWGDDPTFPLDFDWDPVLYAISDGETTEFALLEPDTYGATAEESVYTVSGIYSFASGDDPRYAVLNFDGNGELIDVYGYSDIDGTGAPREITPRQGDQFTIEEQWLQLGEDETEETEFYSVEGGTLTFGTQNFTWEEIAAPAGEYEVGFIAEDLDGNYYEEYAPVVVVD